jgi:SAM-dependent methyltransferase
MKVDLGCAAPQTPGFFGISRREGPGVDLVCDMEKGIPLADDSVETVFAVHSLPYVADLMAVMREVYRICRHKALVCIVAPYAHTYVHAANPHYKTWFNEFTPLYLSHSLYKSDYLNDLPYTVPALPEQVFREEPGVDFQLLKLEFFYYEAFASPLYLEDERELIRHVQPNVVDQVMYHFAVIKQPVSTLEMDAMMNRPLEEPASITERRNRESEQQSIRLAAEQAADPEPEPVQEPTGTEPFQDVSPAPLSPEIQEPSREGIAPRREKRPRSKPLHARRRSKMRAARKSRTKKRAR